MARLSLIFALAAPALVIFVLPALELLARNTEYFNAHLGFATPLFAYALAYAALGTAAYRFGKNSTLGRAAFYAYLLTAPLWMIYSGAFAEDHQSAFFAFIPLAALAGYFCAKKFPQPRTWISPFAIYGGVLALISLFQIFSLHQTASAIHADHQAAIAPAEAPVAGQKTRPDIYHIILDEFQSDLFAEVLNDETRKNFSGLSWFPYASTPFGRTEMAISTLFNGIPYDYREPPIDYIRRGFHDKTALPGRLKSLGYKKIGYLHTNYPADSTPSFDTYYFHRALGKSLSGKEARQLLKALWWFVYFPPSIAAHFVPGQQGEQLDNQALLPNDAPYISLQSFRIFMDRERQTAERGNRYIFIHLIIPHFPKVLEADCRYQNGRETHILDQTRCAVALLGEFLQMLKDTGRFKDSLLLIHGDHGSQYIKVNGEMQKAPDAYFGPQYSWARSRPLVLVKPPGMDAATPLQEKSWRIDLLDLYPSVMDALGENVSLLTGTSLFAKSYTPRPRLYHFYDKDKSGTNQIVSGPIKRYRVEDRKLVFDQDITVPLETKKSP